MLKLEIRTRLFPLLLVFGIAIVAVACQPDQQKADAQEEEYTRVLTERVDKIVAPLAITDPAKARRVQDIIVQQYRGLRGIHDARDAEIKDLQGQTDDKIVLDARVGIIREEAKNRQQELHNTYLSKLSEELTAEQIEQVKDGMTYNAYPITYNNYLAMLPSLSEEQKSRIRSWLIEAREHAMDEGSSEEKLAWFGKYKGKITNYLSAAGYDLKKAEKDWTNRRRDEATVHKIMDSLSITDSTTANRVQAIVTHQYKRLRVIHNVRDARVEAAEHLAEENKKASDEEVIAAWEDAKVELKALHNQYLSRLSAELTPEQIIIVKDGMTDQGLQKDYSRFLAMLPDLTEAQKSVILRHLLEARENAMDAGSPKEIRQWFAKYRGRANNYLSDAGYDLRKATEYLENKQKEEAEAGGKNEAPSE